MIGHRDGPRNPPDSTSRFDQFVSLNSAVAFYGSDTGGTTRTRNPARVPDRDPRPRRPHRPPAPL